MHHMITSWLSDFKLDEKGVLAEHWLGLAPWELPALEARVEKGTSTPCLSAEGALQGGLTNFPSATSGKRVSCQSYSGKLFKLLFIKHHYSLCIILQGKPMFSFPHCKVLSCQDLALTGS